MELKAALIEAADHLRKAAALLESVVRGDEPTHAPRVVDLRGKIRSALESGRLMTSAEVTDELFTGELGIDKGTFRRRVIVTLSSMNKKHHEVELVNTDQGTMWRRTKPAKTATAPDVGAATVEES